jgi:hypothetical protein
MKMMSWSRYHCLSKSLLRAERRYRATKILKTRQRSRAPHPRPPAPGAWRRLGFDPLFPTCNPAVSNLTKLVLTLGSA